MMKLPERGHAARTNEESVSEVLQQIQQLNRDQAIKEDRGSVTLENLPKPPYIQRLISPEQQGAALVCLCGHASLMPADIPLEATQLYRCLFCTSLYSFPDEFQSEFKLGLPGNTRIVRAHHYTTVLVTPLQVRKDGRPKQQ